LFSFFATCVIDTGGKFATGINNTSETDAAGDLPISPRIFEKFETVLMGCSGAGGKLIHKKTRSKKSRDTVPLMVQIQHYIKQWSELLSQINIRI
jgi:hypothetical protein